MQHKVDDDDPLAHIPLFAHLSQADRDAVRSLMTDVRIETGQVLTKEGAPGKEFFVVLSGTAKVERGGDHLADIGPGDFQGEISLLDGGPRMATVTATSAMELLVATHLEFTSLLDRAPMIGRQMLPALAHRVRAMADDHRH